VSSKRPSYKAKYDECEDDLRRKEVDCEKDIRKASGRDFADLVKNIERDASRFTYQQALDMVNVAASVIRRTNVLNPLFEYIVDTWNDKKKLDVMLEAMGKSHGRTQSYGQALSGFLDAFIDVDRDVHSVMRAVVDNIKVLNR